MIPELGTVLGEEGTCSPCVGDVRWQGFRCSVRPAFLHHKHLEDQLCSTQRSWSEEAAMSPWSQLRHVDRTAGKSSYARPRTSRRQDKLQSTACKHTRTQLDMKMTQEATDGRGLCLALETSTLR